MKIEIVGGGPAGLYFAILMKKARSRTPRSPSSSATAPTTPSAGASSSPTRRSANFEAADPRDLSPRSARASRTGATSTSSSGGERVRSTGHGFCGLVAQARCCRSSTTARASSASSSRSSARSPTSSDARRAPTSSSRADGVNSRRARRAAPSTSSPTHRLAAAAASPGSARRCRSTAFTFIFRENEHGLFQVHAYPFAGRGLSTFIVECREETWKRARASTARRGRDRRATASASSPTDLRGPPRCSTNRSIWRRFPTVRTRALAPRQRRAARRRRAHGALLDRLRARSSRWRTRSRSSTRSGAHGTDDVPARARGLRGRRGALDVARAPARGADEPRVVRELARATCARIPLQFAFNLMTRSKRITYDNLGERDPALVAPRRDAVVARPRTRRRAGDASDGSRCRRRCSRRSACAGCTLANRVVVSPMCQYSRRRRHADDWHLVHLGSRAVGGAGLVIAEMTDVSRGRAHHARLRRACTSRRARRGVEAHRRLRARAHARARSASSSRTRAARARAACPWEGDDPAARRARVADARPVRGSPSTPDWPVPRAMDRADMDRVRDDFVRAARAARRGGLRRARAAHGARLPALDLPLAARRTARRTSTAARSRTACASRSRSSTPCAPRGRRRSRSPCASRRPTGRPRAGSTTEDRVALARALKAHGCDVIDVSRRQRRTSSPSTAACTRCPSARRSATRRASRSWRSARPGRRPVQHDPRRRPRRPVRAGAAAPRRSLPHAARRRAATATTSSPGRRSTGRRSRGARAPSGLAGGLCPRRRRRFSLKLVGWLPELEPRMWMRPSMKQPSAMATVPASTSAKTRARAHISSRPMTVRRPWISPAITASSAVRSPFTRPPSLTRQNPSTAIGPSNVPDSSTESVPVGSRGSRARQDASRRAPRCR